MLHGFTWASAIVALTTPLYATDTVGVGWGADSVRVLTLQSSFASHDTLANGNRVVFDGTLVWLEEDDGTVLATIGATPVPSFSSFIQIDPTETFAVLGESSNGVIYRVALSGIGGLAPLVTLVNNTDIAFESSGATALVSAATCGLGCGNEIHRLDVATGASTLVASLAGPSGPLAVSGSGDLYYATQSETFPTPPDAVVVIRWTSAQITNGPFPLTQAQAAIFTAGLDGGSSMAFDPQFGHLFVGESVYLSTSRVLEIDRFGAVVGEVASSLDFQSKIEVFDAPGAGVLGAFQPAGARLQYRTTDFNQGTSQIVRVSPRRPQLTAVQNGNGTMTVSLSGATPGTNGFVISSQVALYNPSESSFDLVNYLFWTGMPYPNNIRRVGNQIAMDANGQGSFTFANSGPIQGTRVIQVLVRDASGLLRGSSTAVTN